MTLSRNLAAALVGLAAATIPDPAQAQRQQNVCVKNQSGMVIRSQFQYRDYRGRVHLSAWQRSALGQENCVRLQDATQLLISVEAVDPARFGQWRVICNRSARETNPNVVVMVTGTAFNPVCTLQD